MQIQTKELLKRGIFLILGILAAVILIVVNHERQKGANYRPNTEPLDSLTQSDGTSDSGNAPIAEPEHLNKIIRLTFGGNCTVGAALGTDSFGTFNHTADLDGREFFFSELAGLFAEDDCTVLGCSAVLTDRELTFGSTGEDTLPYLGPAENGAIFDLSSVDLVSLANDRVRLCGTEGTADTKAALESHNTSWTDDENAYYFEQGGIRIAVLGASATVPGATETIVKRASIVSETCGYVVVYADRDEGSDEYYANLARSAIDAGADLVCFTGYAPEEAAVNVETYNEGIIVNSLGYLIDGGSFTASDTAIFRITLTVEEDTIVRVEGELIPVTFGTLPWLPMIK